MEGGRFGNPAGEPFDQAAGDGGGEQGVAGALDSASGEEVSRLLRELNADGQTILVVTHDMALAESCTRRTVRLVDGRITSDVTSCATATAVGTEPESVR